MKSHALMTALIGLSLASPALAWRRSLSPPPPGSWNPRPMDTIRTIRLQEARIRVTGSEQFVFEGRLGDFSITATYSGSNYENSRDDWSLGDNGSCEIYLHVVDEQDGVRIDMNKTYWSSLGQSGCSQDRVQYLGCLRAKKKVVLQYNETQNKIWDISCL